MTKDPIFGSYTEGFEHTVCGLTGGLDANPLIFVTIRVIINIKKLLNEKVPPQCTHNKFYNDLF